MKKNIFKFFLSLTAAAVVLASCTEDIVKADYDYTPIPGEVPTNVVSIAVTDTSVVEATVTGSVVADSTLLDWGVIYYTADMMVNNTHLTVSAKSAAYNFAFTVKLPNLVPNTNYLWKSYAINVNGITYGDEKGFKTKPASPLPFQLLESDPASKWSGTPLVHIDADGDGRRWSLSYLDGALQTKVGLISYSWFNAALRPENYVIFPPMQLGAGAAKIEFDRYALDNTYFAEKYKVIISTAPITNAAQGRAATVLMTEVLPSAARATKTVNIPANLANRVVWIGLVHFDVTDEYAMAVTNIKVY